MLAPSHVVAAGFTLPAVQAAAERAAKNAGSSPHALINLVRLIKGIESRAPETAEPGDSPVLDVKKREEEIIRDRETLIYARALLTELNSRNEQSSSTSQTLAQLSTTLASLEKTYTSYTPISDPVSSSAPLSRITSRPDTSSRRAAKVHDATTSVPSVSLPPASDPTPGTTIRQRNKRTGPSLAAYLDKRNREDAQGGEAGLLPIAGPSSDSNGKGESVDAEQQRKELLAGNTSRTAISGAQLHEELGGQLAQMSHRLKLNALHFANSLEEEKAILETSQEALEGNLVATKSSKSQLSAVTRKGRGTTCMTLGIVLLVLIIFVWTYMLIRFT